MRNLYTVFKLQDQSFYLACFTSFLMASHLYVQDIHSQQEDGMRHWAESCVGSWCLLPVSGTWDRGDWAPLVLFAESVAFSTFLADRVFSAAKVFAASISNPLLPFGNSCFWHCLLSLKGSKLSIFPCVRTEAQHVISLLIDGSVACVFIISTALEM